MKKIINHSCLLVLISLTIVQCKQADNSKEIVGPSIQHYCEQKLTDVIVYDIFSPPVASRIYAYSNLAFYEAIRFTDTSNHSIIAKLKGFKEIPAPASNQLYNYDLTAIVAFMKVAKTLVFSKDSIQVAKDKIMSQYKNIDEAVFQRSVAFGDTVGAIILQRASNDNYKLTRGMPRYSVFKEKGKWLQTPPDYADAVEPYWNKIQPLLMDTASQFTPPPPPPYDLTNSSVYYKELKEVYDVSKQLTKEQDTIAHYWDDNALVSEHKGHLTYSNKKTTPVGHWMGITAILSGTKAEDKMMTARAYALSASAIFDAFISCWDEKYRSKTIRPISVIRETMESEWNALLQTPPFPEYTSGHSVISAAAATVLTNEFGQDHAFHDTTELQYLGMERSFSSIEAASNEACISRLYGGIHFRSAIEKGKEQGKKIGYLYNNIFEK
ncbi:MAG: phosphatase PAP2 family protein [Sphingobacteriia bacterium]|nr:MAG: phosphatase PAP2 family protein [Sphingobacteriia bacterium]